MIFRQSLRRDLNSVAGVMFATLFTILVTTSLIRFLNRATSDRIASSDILPLIAFNAIGFIPVLLVLTALIATDSADGFDRIGGAPWRGRQTQVCGILNRKAGEISSTSSME